MSDNEGKQSVPEVLSRAQMIEFDEGDLLYKNSDFENTNIERRVSDMSRQIGELTNLVLSLTEMLSSNIREGNGLNTLSSEPNVRSDRFKQLFVRHTYHKHCVVEVITVIAFYGFVMDSKDAQRECGGVINNV